MKPIIKVQNISKQYRIGSSQASYQTLRDALISAAKMPFRKSREEPPAKGRLIWALKDVSFEVEPGELIGVVGRNGAGKSTLLKILSRVTAPTSGRAELYGRLGSLLEIGTGFHPELTGRENIFLNGAILGMRQTEIERKFDEIVAFSEIEMFIDTPVKWYSSGMYVRLAFSVAAYLEPEILMLDEVLAVGDAAFQIKCMNKIESILKDGCTILFVSHNMQAITRLCKRSIFLSDGQVLLDGPTNEVASSYLRSHLRTTAEQAWDDLKDAPGNHVARLRAVRVRAGDGSVIDTIPISDSITIEMDFEVLEGGQKLVPTIAFYNEENVVIMLTHDTDPVWRQRARPTGHYVSAVTVAGNFFAEGKIRIEVALSTHNPLIVHFYHPNALVFQIVDRIDGESARGDYAGPVPGIVRPLLPWKTKYVPAGAHSDAELATEAFS